MKLTPFITLWKVIKLSLIIGVALLLVQYPGHVSISWLDYDIDMGLGVLASGLFVLVTILLWASSLWRGILEIPKNFVKKYRGSRIKKGEEAIVEALTSIAAGEPGIARDKATQAQRLNPDHPLNTIVAAQAAYISGDQSAATKHFHAMTRVKATAFLGSRGLFLQAKQAKDWGQAREYLMRAYELRPNSPWIMNQVVELDLRMGTYDQAKPVVDQMVSRKLLSKTEGHRFHALILWMKAQEALTQGNEEEYRRLLTKANENAPDLVAVAVELARFLHKTDKDSRAVKVLHRAYEVCPHPLIGSALHNILSDLSPLDYYKEVEKLTKSQPEHRETHYLIVKSAIKAHLWGQARHHLQILSAFEDSQRLCRLMAKLEESEHPERPDVSRKWWRKAMYAANDAEWKCRSCHSSHQEWHAFCSSCGALDTINWSYAHGDSDSEALKLMHSKRSATFL